MTINVTVSELSDRYPGFTCFKTEGAIHYPRRWFRDALIWLAFDPMVQKMWSSGVEPHDVGADFSFMTVRGDLLTLVRVSAEGSLGEAPAWPSELINIRRADLCGSRMRACRDIWRHKNHNADLELRLSIVARVRSHGAIPLGQVISGEDRPRWEALAAVLSMAANGFVIIEIADGLDFNSAVRLGPEAPIANRSIFIEASPPPMEGSQPLRPPSEMG